ncbi:hypothetical protein KIN20_008116 [Parelaphostrongylus tenuis]|uniref:Uncharacterized protein n=1 Tax=Parelaphostrongylus tenuis TaxID=148309 RepID=A0AAD5MNC6_PARTN|nr:hypothetical protein KIN20_008116 [Parelaphostrongylus tenuis]
MDDEERLYLELLEEGGTPSAIDKNVKILSLRGSLMMNLPQDAARQNSVSVLLNILESDLHTEGARLNAAWTITKMTCLSKQMIHVIVDKNGIVALKNGILTSTGKLRVHCIMAIGNIALCCSDCKTKCREAGILDEIATLMAGRVHTEMHNVKIIVSCVMNIMHGGVHNGDVPISTIRLLTTCLTDLIRSHITELDLAEHCLWTLAWIADDMQSGAGIDIVINEPGLLELVFDILSLVPLHKLHEGALHILGNIITGNNTQIGVVTSHPQFYEILFCMSTIVNLLIIAHDDKKKLMIGSGTEERGRDYDKCESSADFTTVHI